MTQETNNNSERLIKQLKEMFQIDHGTLDFGIYRIMNSKRVEMENFLNNQLLPQVREVLEEYQPAGLAAKRKELKEAEANPEKFAPAYIAKLKQEISNSTDIDAVEKEIYSDLYNFFRRYYSEGDFMSLRRYKKGVYALPYEGEEVKLYWANADQYYIKTTEDLKHYSFTTEGGKKRVRFTVIDGNTEQNNNKAADGKNRRFILADEPLKKDVNELVIQFKFCPSAEKQDNLNKETVAQLLTLPDVISFGLNIIDDRKKNPDRTTLEKHLADFTAKNSFDYFIHKDLGGFLTRELDFYIKNEIMHLDDIANDTAPQVESYLGKIKAMRQVAGKIIQFLAQLENFQKKLWLKKKFVLETNYCITLDHIISSDKADELLPVIAANEAQREEWKKLFAIDEIQSDLAGGIMLPTNNEQRTTNNEQAIIAFLKVNDKLPVDTRFFDTDFKYKLLSIFDDLDAQTDGLLINSENFQALNLLQERYREKVQCIYIDPPFNTGDDFLYKDSYQTSSWLALLNDRLTLGKFFITERSNFFLHLDENANFLARSLLFQSWSDYNITEIIYNTNSTKDEENDLFGYKSFGNNFVLKHQTIFHIRKEGAFFQKLWKPNRNTTNMNIGWLDLLSEGKNSSAKKIEEFRFYIEKWESGVLKQIDIPLNEKIFPISDLWLDIFSFTQSEMRISESFSFVSSQKPENLLRRIIQSATRQGDLVLDYFAGSGTTLAVAHKLNRKYIGIEMGEYFNTTYKHDDVEKLGLLGRMKFMLKGDQNLEFLGMKRRPHLSKDISWKGGGFIKYMSLEQYEDSLDNIRNLKRDDQQEDLFSISDREVEEKKKQKQKLKEQYMLGYMLEAESRGSQSLLNIDAFADPFTYKLSIRRGDDRKETDIDLIETFNYLLGLTIRSISRAKSGIVTIEGTNSFDENCLIIWRNIHETNNEALNDWFDKRYSATDREFDAIYVNGDNNIQNSKLAENAVWKVRLIEAEFQRLMFDVRDI